MGVAGSDAGSTTAADPDATGVTPRPRAGRVTAMPARGGGVASAVSYGAAAGRRGAAGGAPRAGSPPWWGAGAACGWHARKKKWRTAVASTTCAQPEDARRERGGYGGGGWELALARRRCPQRWDGDYCQPAQRRVCGCVRLRSQGSTVRPKYCQNFKLASKIRTEPNRTEH